MIPPEGLIETAALRSRILKNQHLQQRPQIVWNNRAALTGTFFHEIPVPFFCPVSLLLCSKDGHDLSRR